MQNFEKSLEDIIAINHHSRLASVYKYRPPYTNEFFIEASKKLSLNKTMNLLDLCCGTGELSRGFQRYVSHIDAVDGSLNMLKNFTASDNVTCHLLNVNDGLLPFNKLIDHILVGSAIHWIQYQALKLIIEKNCKLNSLILLSHPSFIFEEEIAAELNKINKKYGNDPDKLKVDFTGRTLMEKLKFNKVDKLKLSKDINLSVNFLFNNQLSYAYGNFYKNILTFPENYKKEFFEKILPFAKNGYLPAKLINSAVFYATSTSS
jgi:SAM-dependent methyltransferase